MLLRNLATLEELQTVYSYADALALFELVLVDSHNIRALAASRRR